MLHLPGDITAALERQGRGLTVLVVRLAALGDVLRTLPPTRLIRRALPECRLLWVVDDRWAMILRSHPDLDRLVEFPRREIDTLRRNPGDWTDLVRRVAGFRHTLRRVGAESGGRSIAIDFHGNLRSGLVLAASRAAVRLGYDGHQQKEGNRWFLTHRIPSGDRRVSRMQRNLGLVASLGLPIEPLPDGGLPIPPESTDAAAQMARTVLGSQGDFAVLSPGVSRSQSYKRPPVDLFVRATSALARRGVPTLVVWGPGEEATASEVVRHADRGAVLAPPTSLQELTALLRLGTVFVGGDTGPMHLACAVGCPVIAIYGPTDPNVNAPWGVPAERVYPPERRYTGIKKTDRAGGGFEGIVPEAIDRAVSDLLDRLGKPGRSTPVSPSADGRTRP